MGVLVQVGENAQERFSYRVTVQHCEERSARTKVKEHVTVAAFAAFLSLGL